MRPSARKFLASSSILVAGLVLGFAVPRPGWSEALWRLVPGRASTPQAAPTVAAKLQPLPPGRDGAESNELKLLRAAEDDLFPELPASQRIPASVAPPRRCGDDPRACRDTIDPVLDGGVGDPAWVAGLRMPDFPVKADGRVERFVRYFTQNSQGRRIFRSWYKRSGRYRATVATGLREHALPADLMAVVMVESGFSPSAVSPAGAAGLWQLMPETARVYGLRVEEDFDERRSVEKSTAAGVRHLHDLYSKFGSWELALASYDMGYRALVTRVRELATNDYWTLASIEGALPREAVLYVPKVIAAAIVLKNVDRFGLDDTHVDPPVATSELDVPPGTDLAIVARAAGTSLRAVRELNPELLTDTVPDRGDGFQVHIPTGGGSRANTMLTRLLDRRDRDGLERAVGPDFDWGKDEVPEQLLARATDEDFELGDRGAAPRVVRRSPLLDPGSDEVGARGQYRDARGRQVVFYRVGESDTLASVARTFDVTEDDVLRDNALDPAARLHKGMLLKLRVPRDAAERHARRREAPPADDAGPEAPGDARRAAADPRADARGDGGPARRPPAVSDADGSAPPPPRKKKDRERTNDAPKDESLDMLDAFALALGEPQRGKRKPYVLGAKKGGRASAHLPEGKKDGGAQP